MPGRSGEGRSEAFDVGLGHDGNRYIDEPFCCPAADETLQFTDGLDPFLLTCLEQSITQPGLQVAQLLVGLAHRRELLRFVVGRVLLD